MNESIKSILTTFFRQVESGDQSTGRYPAHFKDLQLEVGFGIGRIAKIPWITFLGKDQKTTDGIFPVYYFFKENHRLVLAYGVSETHIPKQKWPVTTSMKTIHTYFKERGIKPHKYGESYVYKTYDTKKEFDWPQIEEDLNTLLENYKAVLNT